MSAPTLTSNGTPLPFDGELFAPMRDSSALLDDPAALRDRLGRDGYLYLPGVLDPAAVWELRRGYLARFPAGTFAPGSNPLDGVYAEGAPDRLPPHGVAGHPAHDFVRSATFAEFVDQPALSGLASALLGGEAFRLPRSILRHFHRGSRKSSRAHVDLDYMRLGTDRLVTMWVPVGDCPLRGGGLVYLERSAGIGADRLDSLRSVMDRPDDGRPLSHDLGWVARQLGRRWLWADYRAGDLAVHTPYLVHAALDTDTPAARLSVDVRFVLRDEDPDPRWMRPWSADDGA